MNIECVAEKMLKAARIGVLEHFENARISKKRESSWKKGLILTKDINRLKRKGDVVKIKIKDGMYFYKIVFNHKN